jgi:hypothetical protein
MVSPDQTNHLRDTRFTVSGPQSRGITLETIKRGESDDFTCNTGRTTIVLRLFEGLGGRAKGTLNMQVVRS